MAVCCQEIQPWSWNPATSEFVFVLRALWAPREQFHRTENVSSILTQSINAVWNKQLTLVSMSQLLCRSGNRVPKVETHPAVSLSSCHRRGEFSDERSVSDPGYQHLPSLFFPIFLQTIFSVFTWAFSHSSVTSLRFPMYCLACWSAKDCFCLCTV